VNPIYKRSLAIAAVAPLAWVAAVGPASASSTIEVVPTGPTEVGNAVFYGCDPAYTSPDFSVTVIREDNEDMDAYDIDKVIVYGDDNSNWTFKRARVSYYSENIPNLAAVMENNFRPEKTRSKRVKDGTAFFGDGVDNIRFLKVTGYWKIDEEADLDDNDNDDEHDEETVTCYIELPDPD
jgi:hypothetical protein